MGIFPTDGTSFDPNAAPSIFPTDGTSFDPNAAPPSPGGASVPSYQDFLTQYLAAAQATEKAARTLPNGQSVTPWAWMTGGGRAAATAQAQAGAPDAYLKLLQGQSTTQGGQLDVGQTLTPMNRYRQGHNQPLIDPNNIPGAFAPPSGSLTAPIAARGGGAPMAPAGAGASQPPQNGGMPLAFKPPSGSLTAPIAPVGAPASAAPATPLPMASPGAAAPQNGGMPLAFKPPSGSLTAPIAPAGSQPPQASPTGNPADAQRALYTDLANSMAGLPKFASQALEYSKMAQTGAPAGTIATPGGPLVDAINGKPLNTDVGTLLARRAGQAAGAEATARLPAEIAGQNNQAKNTFSDITDASGNNVPISNYDLRQRQAAGVPATRGLADNPYRAQQIKQTDTAQTNAQGASQMQNAVDQMGAAVKQFGTTGPWAGKAVGALGALNQLGMLDKATSAKLAAGELAKMDSNTVAAGMARQLTQGGRMLAGVFNQVVAAKPSIMTGDPSLMFEALHQEMDRQKDMGSFVPNYYADHANASKLDALTAFDKANPVAKYQSYVMPLDRPANGQFQPGYAYKMKDGGIGVFTGTGFKAYRGLGQYGRQ